ncbi:hypothetical protein [Thermorudis peleae]|uniref:hypothetical protein n=1 Tax=Thermorudis peleae TaxID=1382356 RepID=UPI00056E6342|nr:hypothetical protein [Thermorudis peleae]
MDEQSFLEQVARSIAAVLAGERSPDEFVTAVLLPGWDAQHLGPRADEVVADLEALVVWRSEHVLDEEAWRTELRHVLERVLAWLNTGTSATPVDVEA